MKLTRIGIVLIALIACALVVFPSPGETKTPIPGGSNNGGYGGGGHYGGHGGYGGYGGHGGYYGGHYGHGYGYGYGYGHYGYGWGYPWYYPWGLSFGFGYSPYYYPYYGGYYGAYYPPYSYGGYGYAVGDVRTEIKPSSASVFVDGDYAGTVSDFDGWWEKLKLSADRHRIVFRAAGYAPYAVTMQIAPGGTYNIKFKMTPGEDTIAPDQMRLEPDPRDSQYSRSQNNPAPYHDYRRMPQQGNQSAEMEPNPQQNGPAEPQPDSGNISVFLLVQPADATIYIDDNYFGTAGAQGSNVLKVVLPAGTHKIEIVRPGYRPYSQELEVGPQTNNHVNVTLEQK